MSNCDETQITADLDIILRYNKINSSGEIKKKQETEKNNSIKKIRDYDDDNCVKQFLCGSHDMTSPNYYTSKYLELDIPYFEGKYCPRKNTNTINNVTNTNTNDMDTTNANTNTNTNANTMDTTNTLTTTDTQTTTNVDTVAPLPKQSLDYLIKNIEENIKFNKNYYDIVKNYSEQKTRTYTDTEKKTAKEILNKYKTELEKLKKDKNINENNKNNIQKKIDNIIQLKKNYKFGGGKTKKNKKTKRSNKSKRSKTKKSRRI